MPKPKSKTKTSYRNAITGEYVPKGYAKDNPKTTVKETDKIKKPVKKKGK